MITSQNFLRDSIWNGLDQWHPFKNEFCCGNSTQQGIKTKTKPNTVLEFTVFLHTPYLVRKKDSRLLYQCLGFPVWGKGGKAQTSTSEAREAELSYMVKGAREGRRVGMVVVVVCGWNQPYCRTGCHGQFLVWLLKVGRRVRFQEAAAVRVAGTESGREWE